MIAAVRVIAVHLRVVLMNELQYRVNFFVQLLESAVQTITALIALAVIFDHTTDLNGWTRPQLLVVTGVYTAVGGVIGFWIEPNMQRVLGEVHRGTFDYALTKPVDSQLLASARQFSVWRAIDVVVGLAIAGWGLSGLDRQVSASEVAGFVVTLTVGIVLVYCLWLIVTAGSFWFVRMDQVQELFLGLYHAGQYPVTVYPRWLKLTLTYLMPIGFAVTVPAEAITGRLTTARLVAAGLFFVLVVACTRLVWRAGTRRYSGAST